MQVEIDTVSPTTNGTQMIVENDTDNHEEELLSESLTTTTTTNNASRTGDSDSVDMKDVDKQLTQEDLSLLCDLFYLPFEHGGQGVQLLQEFNWLKGNAHVVLNKSQKDEDPAATAEVSVYSYLFKFKF